MTFHADPIVPAPWPQASPRGGDGCIKVLVVDDCKITRAQIACWLAAETDIEIVGFAENGVEAIELSRFHQPDITLLDIDMPVMDGLTALPDIIKASPMGRVIVASAMTQRGKNITIQALSAGACDYLAKPDASDVCGVDYRNALIVKIRLLGTRRHLDSRGTCQSCLTAPSPNGPNCDLVHGRQRPMFKRPRAVFIGASTGGPEALGVVLGALAGKIHVPFLIAQHMPAGFTTALAEQLNKVTGGRVIEARDDMMCVGGHFYLAPGNCQMSVCLKDDELHIALKPNPRANRSATAITKPTIDPLFRSAGRALGGASLAIMLTGMGEDGKEGAKAMVSKGSLLIAQDEATSVAWGMPGAVVKAGIATVQRPLHDIAPAILAIMEGEFP